MSDIKVIELNCPGCGARVSISQKECDWCHRPIVISTYNSVMNMSFGEVNKYIETYKSLEMNSSNVSGLNKAMGICYLKLRFYKEALNAFHRAFENDFTDDEAAFYAAVCALGGKKAFVNKREEIDKALQYINAAISIKCKGIYYFFLSYIKYDYFERKRFKSEPNYRECLAVAMEHGFSHLDKQYLFEMLNINAPKTLDI
ncbi:tetratricopeptide repeat protein [Anaerovibrio lipolyticus]|uniref:tetratricopeptide repeat protein n=1 Tax=Anaerovibrio lipolyticus TaxID=82374 RepID=UPI00048829C9|nr:tetratricopeptide repeat protein [Anaerovibrio lipolyticus]